MISIQNSLRLVVWALIILVSAIGCKSKKKAMEAADAKVQQEQTAALKKQQEEDERKRKEVEEQERLAREAMAREDAAKAVGPTAKLSEYFSAIANSSNAASANNTINEALSMFASPDTPVLIVISEYDGNKKDYDRPTVIRDYLNYLKDQKKNINTISDLKVDSSGKITEVELKKPL